MTKWEIETADTEKCSLCLSELLDAGWEPFAVVPREAGTRFSPPVDTVYLRRPVWVEEE